MQFFFIFISIFMFCYSICDDSLVNFKKLRKVDCIKEHVVFCFWTGKNPMSHQRLNCLKKLKKLSGIRLIVVNEKNLNDFILPEAPLHPAYQHLSETHKADYLRTYFMHFYGGGYTDIKTPSGRARGWLKAFLDLQSAPEIFINGYREISEDGVGFAPNRVFFYNLIGNGAYIVKPNTDLTKIWYKEMINVLNEKLNDLEKFPSRFPQDCKELGYGYPIEWNEILGRIFHKILPNFFGKILYTVPTPDFDNYR